MQWHVLFVPLSHAKNSTGYPFRDSTGERAGPQDGDKQGETSLGCGPSSTLRPNTSFQTHETEGPGGQS